MKPHKNCSNLWFFVLLGSKTKAPRRPFAHRNSPPLHKVHRFGAGGHTHIIHVRYADGHYHIQYPFHRLESTGNLSLALDRATLECLSERCNVAVPFHSHQLLLLLLLFFFFCHVTKQIKYECFDFPPTAESKDS